MQKILNNCLILSKTVVLMKEVIDLIDIEMEILLESIKKLRS